MIQLVAQLKYASDICSDQLKRHVPHAVRFNVSFADSRSGLRVSLTDIASQPRSSFICLPQQLVTVLVNGRM